jgi:hypothetical protein
MLLPGIAMNLIGRDAKPLTAGRPDYGVDPPVSGSRADISTVTYRLDIGPGESRDVIFTAPKLPAGANLRNYSFYDRNYGFVKKETTNTDPAREGYGGTRTEVRIYPAGTLPTQPRPNGLYDPNSGVWTWASGTQPL